MNKLHITIVAALLAVAAVLGAVRRDAHGSLGAAHASATQRPRARTREHSSIASRRR